MNLYLSIKTHPQIPDWKPIIRVAGRDGLRTVVSRQTLQPRLVLRTVCNVTIQIGTPTTVGLPSSIKGLSNNHQGVPNNTGHRTLKNDPLSQRTKLDLGVIPFCGNPGEPNLPFSDILV